MRLPQGLLTPPIAHRGLWRPEGPPENSLGAIEAACAAGYGAEFDVRLSADDEAVVIHDETLERLCGINAFIADYAAADLQALRLCGGEERIPTLAQALRQAGGRQLLLVELKAPHVSDVLEERMAEELDRYEGPVAVISFHAASLAWFAENRPDIPRGLDAAGASDEFLDRSEMDLENLFQDQFDLARPHFLVLNMDMVGGRIANRHRAQGLPVIAWTARSAEDVAGIAGRADNFIFEGFTA